jgi:ATP-dependent Lon protease
MAKFTFAVFPVKFFAFPLTEKENIGVSRTFSINALQQKNYDIIAVPQKRFDMAEIKGEEDLLKVGALVDNWKKLQEEKGIWRVGISFNAAVKIDRVWFDNDLSCFLGEGEPIHLSPSIEEADFFLAEACKYIFGYFSASEFFHLAPTLQAVIQKTYSWLRNTHPSAISQDPAIQWKITTTLLNILDTGDICYFMLHQDYGRILLSQNFKELIMNTLDFVRQLEQRVQDRKKVEERASELASKQQRVAYLSFLRDAINEELKEITKTTGDSEIDEILSQIEGNPNLPEDLKKKLAEELETVAGPATNPERPITIRHVQFVLSLPWGKYVEPNTNFEEVKRALEKSHYGLNDVKERVLEYLALYTHLKRPPKGNILCFVGPPGTGKTSMAAAIAKALNLPFYRVSLGGISDEAEIKGHRRTYIGAMPGRIAVALSQIGALNGIIFLDEIDKLGISYKGRPDAALLDALDPDRNHDFIDHYVDYPIDLSNVLFICGANVQQNIDPILADRMEFVSFAGYIFPEKFQIAKYYIIPKLRESWQIPEETVNITDEAIVEIIKTWGRWESGVREVKRQIESAFRKALGLGEKKITAKFIKHHFQPPAPLVEWKSEYAQKVGYVPVIGINRSGEGIAFWVEIHKVKIDDDTKGWNIEIIGSADENMKDSAKSAFLWCLHHIPSFADNKYKWIIYLPSVSIPRGGPSASLSFAIGLICAHLNRPIGRLIAMTGEISASGKILPVGGIPAKVIAAENAGFEEILIPAANKDELSFWLKQRKLSLKIKVTPVETIEEALEKLDIKVPLSASRQNLSPTAVKIETEGRLL